MILKNTKAYTHEYKCIPNKECWKDFNHNNKNTQVFKVFKMISTSNNGFSLTFFL